MKCEKRGRALNLSLLTIWLVIFLKNIKASIRISDFTYPSEKAVLNAEQIETDYISILKLKNDGKSTPNFEISDRYLISEDNTIQNCYAPNDDHGKVLIKKNDKNKFLFVQKQDEDIFIKDRNYKCSLISSLEKTDRPYQIVQENHEKITVGDIANCDSNTRKKFIDYFNLLDSFFISENEKCETVLKTPLTKNVQVIDCVGYIGHITNFPELKHSTYYICFKTNESSLLISTFSADKTIANNTFYCTFDNPVCPLTISVSLFNNVPYIMDKSLVLKPDCSVISTPIYKEDHVLSGDHYIFFFKNDNTTYYREICILKDMKYHKVGNLFSIEIYGPIICFIGSECVIKTYTAVEKMQYIMNNIESTTFSWSPSNCNNKDAKKNAITTYLKEEDGLLYIISEKILLQENILCTKNNTKLRHLLSIELVENPQYSLYYSIINSVIMNDNWQNIKYNNYLGPFVKYECSHEEIVINEYDIWKSNYDNEYIHKNEELNFNIDFSALTMRLCVKQINYIDIGSVRIEQLFGFKVNNLDPLEVSAIVSLYNEDINTRLLKFAIKEDENCNSSKGFFIHSKGNYPKEIFHKDIIVDARAEYEVQEEINLDKPRYYLCMCSLAEKCNYSNGLSAYNLYTNIYINNEIIPQEKKKYVCKLFSPCNFTVKFESDNISNLWAAKVGTSCRTYAFADIKIKFKKNDKLSKADSNIIAVDFSVFYNVSQINNNILNEDLVICGNYKDQKFAFTIEADFFFTYISSPYQKFEIKNIEYENLCRDKKTLNIYSYQNGETNLYKKVAIDINSNLSEIELNIEYDHLKYYKIFFIKECHYCKGVITYTHRGNSYSLHNPVRNPEKYWEPKIGKMNRNNKDFKKSIKMHNCAYETMQNHALTSLLLFDGPHEEINFYCYRGTNCRHKAKFTLLWYHYTIYVEVTETERIIISYRENKEKKIIAEEILLGMRNSDLYLRISKHVIEKMNPGPYKIIYSRKIGESFKENYIGTFYYVGPSRQPFQIIAKDETEITLHGYFKNINDKHITVFRYLTCDFYTFLRNNYRELWDLEKIYDNIKEEIFNNIQSCTVSGEDKLTCKDMEPIRKKYALCWCYGDRQNFCNRLENMQFLITEISSLDHSINPLVQINMPPNAVFMNYNTEGYFFLVEDDCHDIKHFHLKSQLNKEEHILNLYKELESPKKYNLCVCKVTQNVACDSENQFKPLELEFGYTIDDKEKLKDDLQHFNTGMRAVKDFTFSSEFMELLHKGVMQAMVFLSGFMGYKEYVCLSGVPCKTPIKMQTVYSSQVKYFLDIMQLKKMKQIVKKESTDKERENKKGQAQEIEEEEEEEKNKENEDPLMYFSYLRPHPDDTETKEDTIYFTLSDTRECKNEYSQFYKEVKGEIVRTQEIDLTLQKILEVSFDLNIDFIPPDVRKPYEICAFLRPTDKHYYNIGNVIFYGLFNESKLVEIVSGIPFNLQLKQFNSKYNVRIRFVYEHYEDSNACKNNYGNSENFFYSESVQQLLTADEKEEIGGKVTVHKWNDLLTVLDADNYNIMVGHRNDDGSHNLHVCSCYELVEGLCNNDYYYSADSMIIKVHTAVLTEPPMNSIIHFMKPFTLKLKTSKVLNGSIRIFPIDIMKDLSKICLEINQRDYFLTFPAKVEEYEQTYDANVNFLSQAVVACWCSKEKCESADYINKVAFFKLSSPSILEVHTDMDGYFTFSFLNEWVHINDRILFVAEDLPCTDDTSASLFDDIIHINNKEYHIGWEQIIEIYGKPRKIVKEIDDNFTWISKIYKITNILEKYLKICYCFYYYSENCKDRKNYSYIGLLHNHTLGKGVADKNDQIDQTVNMYTLNGNSIKFVPMISYNDSNRDICNTRGNQSNGIIPIFKNTAFNNSANFKLRILNIFKQHYQNEINFVVCYSSYYYRYKNTYLLRKVEYNELSRAPNPIIHNYTLGHAGITSESSQNLVPRREHREKIENLLKSYSKIKQRKTFFYNYFMEEALFSNRDTLPTGFSTDTMGYKTGDENGGDDEDKENDAEINRLMDEGMRRMIEQKEKEQEEKAENGGEEKDAKERDAKEKVDEEKDAKEEDAKEEDAKEEDAKESDDEENEEEEYADDENEEEEYADDEKDDESKEREDKGGKQRVFFDNDDKEDKIRGYSEGHYLSQLDNKGKNKNKNRTGVKHLLIYITRAIRKKIIIALSKFYEGVQMEPQEIMYYKRKSGATVNYILDSITLKNDLSIFVCCYEGDFLESLPIEQNSYPNINKTYKVYLLYKVLSLYFYNINENIEGNNSALEQLNNAHDVYHEYKYLRIENLKEKGFYKNQTLVQLKDTTFELKIQGKNIPPHEYTLYIVEFDNNCYRLDKNGYHVENNEYTLHSNYIIFKNVLMNKRNTYKLCILDKTQDTYNDVGILNINNYYVKLESFFDENFISSNLKKMNIMLNVCVNNNSYDAYVIKRKGSFKITLDMEKLAFSDKSQQLEEIFPEIRNHQLISCKSKKHGTIILTNTHLFFYALVTKLSFSTNHNLPFPVDVDFDESYIYVTDLNLRKIARFQIFSEGSAINIINNAKRKRSIHDQDLRAYKRNTPMGEQGTTSKNITLFYPKEGRNFYTTDLVPSPLHGAVYPYGARNFKTALLTSKEAPKKEAIVLTKRSKQSADSYTENAHQNLLQLRMLRRDMRNEKEKTARLRRAEQSAPHNHPRGQQIKLDANPNVDASKKKPKSVANKEENALVKNVRELYNYLQKKVDNNGLINYFHGLLGPQKISKRRNSMYSFLDFFKNGKKKNLSSGNKNEVHSQIVPSSMPARAKKQARRPVPRSENAARPRITVARKKRDATENVDHSVYDEEIEKNIKNLITVVQTSNYLTNQMEHLDLKGHQSPLFISIQDNILYILDSTKNNFFSYNLYSKRIIQLEQYSAANHKFFLKNPLNFSIYRGEKTVHTPYRTNVAFVTQIRSNEIKIIDLNKNKYRIVKAIRLEKGYIHNAVNKVIAIDQNLLIITSHINAENIIYHYHFNSFDQYFSISFEYTFAKNYNSNDYLNIAPEIDIYSDSVIFFCFLNSFDLCTKVDPLTKLEISTETGVITGKLKHFGYFQLKIFAKTHFQHQVKVYTDLYSYCDVGKQYNYANQTCESCPIGTFWNSVELKCDLCKKYFKNRSTLKRGSKLITDCLCSAGYEYSEKTASCEQCKPGYYKKSTGNFICIKGCPINRKSTIYGAKSYNQMNCKCSEGYYELNGKCVLCLKNYYCPGNDQLIHCPKNKMSPEGITSADECVCKRNFIHNENNQSCTYCTSVGKVKDEVIYCSLCDPRYLDTNVFAIPNDHNYGLVDKIFNYDEDLLLQGKTLQYAYFDNNGRKNGRENGNKNNPLNDPPNDRKIDHANFGTLNINSELVLGNNPDEPNRETFAIEIDMPKPTKCVFCESGYFMDIKKERCLPCSNKYCEGFAKNPKGCPTNSVVSRTVASSIFDCKCKIGYGSINERRSALDKKLSCKLCPKNFFSHNLSEQYCLPCPQHTYTVSEGSTSILNCLPVEGYFLLMFRSIGIEYVRYKFDINSEDRIYSYFQDSVKSFDDDVYELFLDQKFEQLFNDADNNPDKRGQQNNEAVLPAKGQQNDGAVLPPNGQQNNGAALPANGQQNNGAALPANGQQNNGAALPPEGQYNAQNAQNAQNEQNAPNAANAPNAQDNKYNLEHLKKMGFLKRTSLFYIYTVLMKNIEENYDWESDKMLKVTCHVNLHLKSSPNFTISYKPNLQSCVDSCKTNIYCTGVEFSRKKVEYTQIFLKNNQKIIVGYFKCKHYSFESIYDYTSPNVDEFFDENVENAVVSRTPVAYTDFILRNKNSIIFTCSIDRDRKFLLYKQYQPVGCFMGKFCPGNYTPYLISCPDNSKTVVTLAKHVDKCLCMKGYSYVGIATLRCAVCERGTYKKNVGNFKCENCPLTFSTVNIGSTSIYDCSCTPGNYLSFDTLQNFINSEKINYKNIIDQYFIVPKKKQTDVYYRTEIVKISLNNLNRIEVNEGTNQTLKREIAVCRPCSLDNHYCEGGLESDITLNNKRFQGQFHTLPKKCPNDLVIPKGIIQRSSINNCICIHGKFLRTSKDKKVECIPCPPNTFKENEYDNSCSGVCPHFSTTFIGSSYENQCFCKNSYYLVTTEDDNDGENSANRMESSKRTKSCKPCPKGAVCNRGFNINLFLHLLKNRAYNNINILDHENPYPLYGHYAVYKEKHPISDWNPLEDNDELKYSYPYYNLLLFIQKNVESGNYFFFEKNPNLYLNMEFIESIKKKKANKKATNAAEADEADEAHNPLFHQANAISILKYALKDSKSVKNPNEVIPNKHTNAIYTYLKKMVPTTLLAKPEPRPTPPLLQSNEMEYSFQEMFNKYIEEANELRKKNNKFERLPDIHVCTLPDRCLGTITNLCQEGSTGYQCNNCQKGYDMSHFKSNCNRCKNFFNEILLMVLLKMIYYIIIIVIVSLNYNSCFNKLYISGILMKIWFNGSFTLVAYGFFSPTANSFITKYWHIYKSVFLSHLKMFSYYLRVACFAHSYNTDMRYNEIWYIQKYVNIFTPLFDAISITLIMFVILHVYKLFCKKKIQNFEHILSTIPELKAKYHLDCLTKDPGGKASPKKGKKSKIYVSNKTEEGDNQDSCNHSTVTHDLEKNGVSDKENAGETNGKSALIDENAPSVPNLTNKKDAQVFCEDDVLHKVDGDDPNGECPKYELKYLNRDDKMYDIFLHETVEYIYNKKIFGPWRFMHKRNEKLGRRLLTFLHDTFPCYILLIALSSPYVLMEVIQLAFCKPIKYKSQESELYLSYLTTQKCTLSDSSFFTGIMVVILALFFYVGIFTLLITLYSKRNKYKLFNILLSNLLTGYKQGKEIFEFIFILKNIILVLLITFSIHHEFYYVILITVILTTFSILEIYSNPFDGRSFNILNISLCLGNVLNIFVALTIWGSFYWNYEQFFFVPILIILFYHLYMLHKIIREIILSRHFIRTENFISIKTAGYGESNIKHNNYKLYYKVMNKIKFFLNKNQKKNILSKQSPNNDGPNKINRMSRENIKFEPIENIIKRYNINLNDDLSKAKNLNPNEEEEKKKKEMFCIKKNHLPVNIHNVALIWYDEQNEDLLFQMPFENKFCLDLNGDKAKNKKKKFFSFFPNYARDKRRRKNIKYFVSAIIEIIDKFLCASKMGSIYENWFDFSMRFAFVYISWIKKVNKTNVVLPHNMEQLKMNIDQYVFFPLFYKCELINQERRKLSVSANTPEDQPENSAPIEALEKKQSFENTEIKISRSYGSYNQMGSLKNRKHAQEKNNHIMNDNYSDDAPSDKDAPSKGKNETRKSSEEQAQMGVLSYLKKKEKKKKKTQAKLKKKSIKMDNPEIHNHINHKDHSYKFENIFNHSMDIFSSEMFNESTFNMLISLFELYIAMKTLKSMDMQSFTKLYQLYNEKFIRFEKSLVFYINKLRDEIKLETEEIDNEIKTGDTAEKMRVKNYYFYKEELNKRKKLEQELMSKIECLKDCIDVNEKSQSLRNVLKNSRKSKPSDGILDEDIHYIFSVLQNEGTYKLDHSKTKEPNE
ncbi:hypothetical protein PVMG_00713 [Plasmodium vivax Mauritania I]|uniref:Cysteine repeat modular protein 4 n=1 Tax=Plasmodium vivax Mauritania I TaxID=1035515 RepID=A0A0J9T8N2_PLAVI|nr:hypothetical protein PVMG_00713 [Plasmodium vivax Mauritania I]